MIFPNFIGPTYQAPTVNADAEDCINWIPERIESDGGKNRLIYVRRPGLQTFVTMPRTPVRGVFAGENRLFVIAGDHYFEVQSNGNIIDYGSVGNDGNPVDLKFNGTQVLIASAGWGWLSNGGAVSAVHYINPWTDLAIQAGNNTQISSAAKPFGAADVGDGIDITGGAGFTPGFYTVLSVAAGIATLNAPVGTAGSTGGQGAQRVPMGRAMFLDSYFWAQNAINNAKTFNLSALLDGSTWDPLQFATKEAFPDNLNAILADHEEMYLFGDEQSTEVWRANGQVQPNFPYQRDPGAIMHFGSAAAFAPARFGHGVAWLARDQERGGVIAMYAEGYRPTRISTNAVENAWNGYSTVADAVAYTEIRNGHESWVISFPSGNATWGYDRSTGLWHRRGWWNGTSQDRQRVAFQCFVGIGTTAPAYYGGDWQNGKIYKVSNSFLSDDGTAIFRQRVTPYLFDEAHRVFHHDLHIDMMGSGTNSATLEWSDDSAVTWSNKHIAGWSPTAAKRMGLVFRRVGASRGRVYRLTISDAVDVALINAYFRATQGSN